MKRVAMFLSADSFEGFFGGTFGLDRERYITSYRNDFVWEYARGLRDAGHHVFIYVLSYGPAELRAVERNVSVRFVPLPAWFRCLDVVLYRLRSPRGYSLRADFAYRAYGAALKRALENDRIQVLYVQEFWTSRFDVVIRNVAIPVIGADHGALYADWMEPIKRTTLPRARKLICQSATTLEKVRSLRGNGVLISNGVDTTFFEPPPAPAVREKSILAVGRLAEEQKRFTDLLQALALLTDFTLTIVGQGPQEAELRAASSSLGISERVRFAGFVADRRELRALYQGCGAFVSTSKWEAVALVMLEAMSCGAPCVATRIPAFEELFTDGEDGLLVPVGSPQDLARAIRRAYDDRVRLGENARAKVTRRYSSGPRYRQLSALIEAAS